MLSRFSLQKNEFQNSNFKLSTGHCSKCWMPIWFLIYFHFWRIFLVYSVNFTHFGKNCIHRFCKTEYHSKCCSTFKRLNLESFVSKLCVRNLVTSDGQMIESRQFKQSFFIIFKNPENFCIAKPLTKLQRIVHFLITFESRHCYDKAARFVQVIAKYFASRI